MATSAARGVGVDLHEVLAKSATTAVDRPPIRRRGADAAASARASLVPEIVARDHADDVPVESVGLRTGLEDAPGEGEPVHAGPRAVRLRVQPENDNVGFVVRCRTLDELDLAATPRCVLARVNCPLSGRLEMIMTTCPTSY